VRAQFKWVPDGWSVCRSFFLIQEQFGAREEEVFAAAVHEKVARAADVVMKLLMARKVCNGARTEM